MSERDNEGESDNMRDKNTQVSFCLFCNGTGTLRDPVLLRAEPCHHCQGKGHG
jgi:DnaJ-class molecular chaperone